MSSPTKKKQLWGSHLSESASEVNILFCAGRDVQSIPLADEELIPYDIFTNIAHSKMLAKKGIFDEKELETLLTALREIYKLFQQGNFTLDPTKEDVHSNIEFWLVEQKQISFAKKIHSGRSRNDQVATDLRMLLRDKILEYALSCTELAQTISEIAIKHVNSPMPGFTHYQPAMWCTFGFWLSSWIESLLRTLERAKNLFQEINFCPLGSAAGFGTSWSVDRFFVSDALAFKAPTKNNLDTILSRTELEASTAFVFCQATHQFSNIAQDLILLSHPYFGMIQIHDRFVTGSSIMPQKKNPDFAEVIKGKAAFATGILTTLMELQKAAFSGYNRDAQVGKYGILDLFRELFPIPKILQGVLETMETQKKTMLEKCKIGFMHSSDIADWLSYQHGLAFRDAYNLLAVAVKYSEGKGLVQKDALKKAMNELGINIQINEEDLKKLSDPMKCLQLRDHVGSPSPKKVTETLGLQKEQIQNLQNSFLSTQNQISSKLSALLYP